MRKIFLLLSVFISVVASAQGIPKVRQYVGYDTATQVIVRGPLIPPRDVHRSDSLLAIRRNMSDSTLEFWKGPVLGWQKIGTGGGGLNLDTLDVNPFNGYFTNEGYLFFITVGGDTTDGIFIGSGGGGDETDPFSVHITDTATMLSPYLRSANAAVMYVPLTRTISPGYGLTGGGDLSANRTLTVDTTTIQKKLSAGTGIALSGNTIYSTGSSTLPDSVFLNVPKTLTTKRAYFFGTSLTKGHNAYKIDGITLDSTKRWTRLVSDAAHFTELNFGIPGMTIQKRTPLASAGNMVDQINSNLPTKSSVDSILVIEGMANDADQQRQGNTNYQKANFITDLTKIVDTALARGWPAADIYLVPSNFWNQSVITPAIQDSLFAATQSVATTKGTKFVDVYHTSILYQNQWYNDDVAVVHPGIGGHSIWAQKFLNVLTNPVVKNGQRLASNDTADFAHIRFTAPDTADIQKGGVVMYDQNNNLVKAGNEQFIKNYPSNGIRQNGSIFLHGGISANRIVEGGHVQAISNRISDGLALIRPELYTDGTTSYLSSLSENPVAWKPLDINAGGSFTGIGIAHDAAAIDRLKVGGNINATGSIRASGPLQFDANTGGAVTLAFQSGVGYLLSQNWNGSTFGASQPLNINYSGGTVAIGGNFTGTARVHIAAGTATAGTAPLKINAGTNLTTPEDGTMEYNGTHVYFTIGSTRYQLDQQAGGGSAAWGSITGTLSSQTDLQSALNAKIGSTTTSDIEITDNTKGIILKSPNGTRYRITVNNDGSLTTTSL